MKNLGLIVFILANTFLFGQTNKKTTKTIQANSNELDQIYEPPKNSLFDEHTAKNEQHSNTYVDFKNVLKFNPFLLTRSTFAIGYERQIYNNFTGSLYLGYNYKRDWMQAIGTTSSSDEGAVLSNSSASEISLSSMISEGKFVSGGLFTSIGARMYLDDTQFDGPYLEIQTRYNSYTLDLAQNSTNSTVAFKADSKTTVAISNNSTYLIWGNQYCSSGKSKSTHDIYFGVGIRQTGYDIFKVTNDTENSTQLYNTGNRESSSGLSIIAGYAFGLGF